MISRPGKPRQARYLDTESPGRAEGGHGRAQRVFGASNLLGRVVESAPRWEAIERGTRREITRREHLSPETYGLVRDQARTEAAQELALAPDVVRTLHSASEMAPEAIDELRSLLLLRRELQAHERDPKGYTYPRRT